MPRTLIRKLLKKFSKDFQNFNPIGFLILFFVVQISGVAVFRATISGCTCYRIEMVEKDLGTLSQTLLRKLLKKFSKNFQNFNEGDFYPFLFVVQILV